MKGQEAEKPESKKERGGKGGRDGEVWKGAQRTTTLQRRREAFQGGTYYVLQSQGSENTGEEGARD